MLQDEQWTYPCLGSYYFTERHGFDTDSIVDTCNLGAAEPNGKPERWPQDSQSGRRMDGNGGLRGCALAALSVYFSFYIGRVLQTGSCS